VWDEIATRLPRGWWQGGSQLAAANPVAGAASVVAAYAGTVQAVGTALDALDRPLAQRARRDPRVARLVKVNAHP
jgi:hypothetical protein